MDAIDGEPLGKDIYLRLLTTQLRYQDPLNPMENTEFVTQLAQFSQLEQTAAMKEALDGSTGWISALNRYAAAEWIGKEVRVEGGKFSFSEGVEPRVTYALKEDAAQLSVFIQNDVGQTVRILRGGPQPAGLHHVLWDGRDDQGRLLPHALYRYQVSATDPFGREIRSTTFTEGRVEGVRFEGDQPYLVVQGEAIPASDVVQIQP